MFFSRLAFTLPMSMSCVAFNLRIPPVSLLSSGGTAEMLAALLDSRWTPGSLASRPRMGGFWKLGACWSTEAGSSLLMNTAMASSPL